MKIPTIHLNKTSLFRGFIGCLGTLGFYRGVKSYDYEHNIQMESYKKEMIYYNKEKDRYSKNKYLDVTNEPRQPVKPSYFYFSMTGYGLCGIMIYVNPIMLPIVFVKEMYRLEINLRNIDNEKKTNFYNKLLI
jgi:hypothetical protein